MRLVHFHHIHGVSGVIPIDSIHSGPFFPSSRVGFTGLYTYLYQVISSAKREGENFSDGNIVGLSRIIVFSTDTSQRADF